MKSILALALLLALTGCGSPQHLLESSSATTTIMEGGGTTAGNPILQKLTFSIDTQASVYKTSPTQAGCSFLQVETVSMDLTTGIWKLRVSGFDSASFCSPEDFMAFGQMGIVLERDAAGKTVELTNGLGSFSSPDAIDFTVGGRGTKIEVATGKYAVDYTINFLPALNRLRTVGSPGRNGTPALQIDIDIGGRDTGASPADAHYCTVQAEAARQCTPSQ